MKLISILLPVFNAAPYLYACVKSVIEQTYTNWELIAIDDHSTDQSGQILQNFAENEPRIKVFSNLEKGIIPALRLAFQQSSGIYITRMDADDLMVKDKLSTLQNLLKDQTGSLSTAKVRYFSESTLGDGYLKYQNWLNGLCDHQNHFQEIYKECVIPSPCWMMHRADLIRCGAFEPNTYPEDYDLCFRFYKHQINIIAADQVLHLWRDHPTRTSRTDETYAIQNYFDLKLPYFLDLEYTSDQPLVIWGAGKKGKHLAAMLQAQNISYHWVTNNERKINHQIQGVTIEHFSIIQKLEQPLIIISVAARDAKQMIDEYLAAQQLVAARHYFYFV